MGPLYTLLDDPYKHDNRTVDAYTLYLYIDWLLIMLAGCVAYGIVLCRRQPPLKIGADGKYLLSICSPAVSSDPCNCHAETPTPLLEIVNRPFTGKRIPGWWGCLFEWMGFKGCVPNLERAKLKKLHRLVLYL